MIKSFREYLKEMAEESLPKYNIEIGRAKLEIINPLNNNKKTITDDKLLLDFKTFMSNLITDPKIIIIDFNNHTYDIKYRGNKNILITADRNEKEIKEITLNDEKYKQFKNIMNNLIK